MDQIIAAKSPPEEPSTGSRPERAISLTALGSSSSAVVACAACCVLPLALPAVVLAGAGGTLAWLAAAHIWITIIAIIAVAVAWLWAWRQSRRARARTARSTILMLAASTVLLGFALLWPLIEPGLMEALR